jgi:hypothetical protein
MILSSLGKVGEGGEDEFVHSYNQDYSLGLGDSTLPARPWLVQLSVRLFSCQFWREDHVNQHYTQ